MLRVPRLVALGIDAVAWVAMAVGAGYLGHRLPERWLERDNWLFRERRWERGGRFYVTALRIKRWKGLLPEAGDAFRGGFNKATLSGRDERHLAAHLRETRRAELVHWLIMLGAPPLLLFNRWYDVAAMQVLAVASSVPCIAAQRYNRIRLQRVLAGPCNRRSGV